MKISAIITKPFFDTLKLSVLALFFIGSMIAGTKTNAQNEDAPKDRKEAPGVNQHGSQNDDDPMGKRPGPPPEVKKEPEMIAEHMSKMLTERIDLNTNQQTGVYDIVFNYASSLNGSEFDPMVLDPKIEEILNSEQKVKFREFINTRPHKNGPPLHDDGDKPPTE